MDAKHCKVVILVEQNFFRDNGVEYACALGRGDIQTFATYKEATREVKNRADIATSCGFRITASGNGEEIRDPDTFYWCRYENGSGRAKVFKVMVQYIDGDLFVY